MSSTMLFKKGSGRLQKTLIVLLMAFLSNTAGAQLRLADVFGSHMVLQQNTEVEIWGWHRPGSSVQVRCSWNGNTPIKAQADASRRWSVIVRTPAGDLRAHQIQISDGQSEIQLRDVLIGEVWLASGQSNMEWSIRDSGYPPEQTRADAFPHIRHFKVNHAVSLTPLDSLDAGQWTVCDDNSVQHFSAVAYFFARDLAERYKVPVGIVNSSWGGSQVESWISLEGMRQSEQFKAYAANFPANWADADRFSLEKVKNYVFGGPRADPGAEEEAAYLDPACDITSWKTAKPTFAWDWQNIWAFRGSGYMAIEFKLAEKAATADAVLHLGHGDLAAELYMNGRKIWSGKNHGGVEFSVPASALKAGKNRLVFKQKLADATGWVEMGMRGPESDFFLKTAIGRIDLSGEWKIMPSFAEPHYFVHNSNNLGVAIYNAMIHPLTHFALRGVIWYQGETNAIRAKAYRDAFPLLIRDWRRLWKQPEMPFLFVQLANYEAAHGVSNTGSEWAELREAQALALQLPATGMAVTIDVGESRDIHPKNKLDVGRRLAREALRAAYGEKLRPGSPSRAEVRFDGAVAQVFFPGETEALQVRNQYGYVHGFELAGADKVFHYAKAQVIGNTVQVYCDAVPQPVALRYAWADDPNDVNLYTAEGFPIAPFRTDNWPMKTEGVGFE